MQEERKSNTAGGQTNEKDDRLDEATSSETLSDVESSEETGAKRSDAATSAEGVSSVTPDSISGGGDRGRADGSDTGGPM